MNVADMRKDYTQSGLLEAHADPDPIRQFHLWFDQALSANLPEPNAMTLATCTPDGIPSARIVLLKGYDERGFIFFTNYCSRKGVELLANPRAALIFYWAELERQIRVEGLVEKSSPEESDGYFQSRPRGSRLGAIVSEQSQVIPDRSDLENRMKQLEAAYPGDDIPRPEHWGGFRLIPHLIEFWQGRSSRLHDRLRYRKSVDLWLRERLSP